MDLTNDEILEKYKLWLTNNVFERCDDMFYLVWDGLPHIKENKKCAYFKNLVDHYDDFALYSYLNKHIREFYIVSKEAYNVFDKLEQPVCKILGKTSDETETLYIWGRTRKDGELHLDLNDNIYFLHEFADIVGLHNQKQYDENKMKIYHINKLRRLTDDDCLKVNEICIKSHYIDDDINTIFKCIHLTTLDIRVYDDKDIDDLNKIALFQQAETICIDNVNYENITYNKHIYCYNDCLLVNMKDEDTLSSIKFDKVEYKNIKKINIINCKTNKLDLINKIFKEISSDKFEEK